MLSTDSEMRGLIMLLPSLARSRRRTEAAQSQHEAGQQSLGVLKDVLI